MADVTALGSAFGPGNGAMKPHRLLVVGLGGGGQNAVSRMVREWADGPDVVVVNTDSQALAASPVAERIQIGVGLTQGLGAGGDPAVGKMAAEEDSDKLRALVSQVDLLVLAVALGGGTGSGAAPILARIAREEGAMTLCFATLPFDFEGEGRRRQADEALRALRMHADTVISLPNQRLIGLAGDQTSLVDAFTKADVVLGVGIRALWQLLMQTGIINLNFADVRHLVEHSGGVCSFGYGEGSGLTKADAAVRDLLRSPLLEQGNVIAQAGAMLVNVVGGPDMTLVDVQKAMSQIKAVARADVRMYMGATVDESWQNRFALTVLASESYSETPSRVAEPAAATVAEAEPARETKADVKVRNTAPGRVIQEDFKFESVDKGRFKGVDPTLYEGEDLDIPTFIRKGIKLSFEK